MLPAFTEVGSTFKIPRPRAHRPVTHKEPMYTPTEDSIRWVIWPDYTIVRFEDFNYERDWSWKSDDYLTFYTPANFDDDDAIDWAREQRLV